MKSLQEFISKNILWGFKDNWCLLDQLFEVLDPNSTDPVIRYGTTFDSMYNSQVRSIIRKFDKDSKLPFVSYKLAGEIGNNYKCEKELSIVFTITFAVNAMPSCNKCIKDTDCFISNVVKGITEVFNDDNKNIFKKNWCRKWDQNTKDWEWNINGYVNGEEEMSEIRQSEDGEIYEFDLSIPLLINNWRSSTVCRCEKEIDDCGCN